MANYTLNKNTTYRLPVAFIEESKNKIWLRLYGTTELFFPVCIENRKAGVSISRDERRLTLDDMQHDNSFAPIYEGDALSITF